MKKADTININIGKNDNVSVEVAESNGSIVVVSEKESVDVELKDCVVQPVESEKEHYIGPYSVTPSARTQLLQTSGKVLTSNIVVEPIPQNYGLISWNGSTLSIS